MVKNSTLIYLYSNFDESELVNCSSQDNDLKQFKHVFEFIENNVKRIPDRIIDDILDFAENYS